MTRQTVASDGNSAWTSEPHEYVRPAMTEPRTRSNEISVLNSFSRFMLVGVRATQLQSCGWMVSSPIFLQRLTPSCRETSSMRLCEDSGSNAFPLAARGLDSSISIGTERFRREADTNHCFVKLDRCVPECSTFESASRLSFRKENISG